VGQNAAHPESAVAVMAGHTVSHGLSSPEPLTLTNWPLQLWQCLGQLLPSIAEAVPWTTVAVPRTTVAVPGTAEMHNVF